MANESSQTNKPAPGPVKSLMTAGPSLHYSHANVTAFWLGAVLIYTFTCLFWSKMLAGSFLPFTIESIVDSSRWQLQRFLVYPLSIFEYPWQIVVLGALMGILAIMPPLIAQLLSFIYSLPFLLALAFIADMPAFAVFVALSSVAAACRPLRFRSRFISIALCLAPQIFYWAYFGSIPNTEPVRWGFSFAPWMVAWLTAIMFAAVVLAIGHFTRYKPGPNFLIGLLVLASTIFIFRKYIGFDELAYQQFVASNSPEQVVEFQQHSISQALDDSIKNPAAAKYFSTFFTSSQPVILRQELKDDIRIQFANDHWPTWFAVPQNLNYPAKRQWLLAQYDLFINQKCPWWLPDTIFKKLKGRRSRSKRMPMALYYKAITSEMTPDPLMLTQKELLSFSSDYPRRSCLPIWYEICEKYPSSTEAIEARRRIAMHLAGAGLFDHATRLLEQAAAMINQKIQANQKALPSSAPFFTPFTQPSFTAISDIKLAQVLREVERLLQLIAAQTPVTDPQSKARLSKFILLDQTAPDYPQVVEQLISQTPPDDPLMDNLLLAKAMLIKDRSRQAQDLAKIYQNYKTTDAAREALFELAILKVHNWQDTSLAASPAKKQKSLMEAKATLNDFLRLYPGSSLAPQIKTILDGLPADK